MPYFPIFKPLTLVLVTFCVAVWAGENQLRETLYPGGKIKERYFYYIDAKKQEVRHGKAEEFFLSGAKKGEINWEDGKENGLVIFYFPEGRKSYEVNYKAGKKNGFATVWHPNGQKQWQTVFQSGLTHGVWREWYADGKKKFEANYSAGKLEGLATWWHDNGRLWQERTFQGGVLVKGSVREWSKSGQQTFPPIDKTNFEETLPLEPGKNDSANLKSNKLPK